MSEAEIDAAGKQRLCVNQEARRRDFRRRGVCDYGGRGGPSFPTSRSELQSACSLAPPGLVWSQPAGQACAVAAAGEDGGGRRGGAGGSGAFLCVGVA
jgi:hypothetical protein